MTLPSVKQAEKFDRKTAKESRGIRLKTCPEKPEAEILSLFFFRITEKGEKRHRTPTHQFIWGFLSLVFWEVGCGPEVFSIVDGSV